MKTNLKTQGGAVYRCFLAAGKISLINVVVLAAFVTPLELTRGFWLRDKVYCEDAILHHAYCPGMSTVRQLAQEDGGGKVAYSVDQSQIRVASPGQTTLTTDVAEFPVINLGDSFIEASAIPFGQTLGAVMSATSGKPVLEFGFSSWAPVIYYNWIYRQSLRNGVIVNIFLMVNDVTPHYEYSTLSYKKQALSDTAGPYRFAAPPRDNSLEGMLARHSYLYTKWPLLRQKLMALWTSPVQPPSSGELPTADRRDAIDDFPWLDGRFRTGRSDCNSLERYRAMLPAGSFGQLTYDYLAFSFDERCWDENQRAEVKAAADDINRIVERVALASGTVRVYVVPPGWAFEGENRTGKAAYRIREETTITTLPLSQYLARTIRAPVIPLEPIIRDLKTRHPGQFYFSGDGHWTRQAHRLLGEWLGQALNQ